jgi:pSer/pThr/pTyr-binding forkhead associated (FHA) protein
MEPSDKGTLSGMQDRRRGPGGLVVHVGVATTPLPRGEWVIGRGPEADVRIDDDRVSRRHALVRYAGSGWELLDGGSLNGIWLAGRQVHRIPVPPAGVTVLIGGKEGVRVRLSPDRSSIGPEPADPDIADPGPDPAPGTSPAGVRFQEVTPEWTGWRSPSPAERPPNGSGAARRWSSLVRHAVETARAKGRRRNAD